ncbi:MAG: hypothetical protein JOY64_02155 [Alphaproteobacteria bacterium]|nr:hypothetical protein [Alphaproteobacteria bacterium]MBV8406405.1 hypothetical protein [Alphaproteobacteria bacterium]
MAAIRRDTADREQGARQILEEMLAPLDSRARVWMACAPEWPQQLVQTAEGDGAAGTQGVLKIEAMEEAVQTGALLKSRAELPWRGVTYRMAPELRQAALDSLIEPLALARGRTSSHGVDLLRGELVAAGKAMQSVGPDRLQYAPGLERWAELASRSSTDETLGSYLNEKVSGAISQAEKEGAIAAPEALRWIEAAEPFAALFKGSVETSLALARRRRELFFRRAADIRRLRNYLQRRDQEEAFEELLQDSEHWALHYVGSGGAGKTMLMAYIANRLAKPGKLAVARVDFDFLNPDYPARAPAMLLSAITEELRLQASESSLSLFLHFDNLLGSLNEWIAGERQEHREPIITPELIPFRAVIEAFARACAQLADKVVLILDTCEELAKLRPDGTVPDNVRVTFEVLEAIQPLAPNVRVVFSGRRPLASAGYGGWMARDCALEPRTYLRLFQLRSFTTGEAKAFLAAFHHDDKPLGIDLQESIVTVTKVVETSVDMFSSDALPRVEPRHNPYDVALFAEWVATDSSIDAKRLRDAGPYFYVQERIVGRLEPQLRDVLPALAVLGRFDRHLLASLLAASPKPEEVIDQVIQQEWVRADHSASGGKWLIDEALRDRILAYCVEHMPDELATARERLAAILRPMTTEGPWSQLAEQYFAAMFSALADRPEEAAKWWRDIEDRLAREAAWRGWAQQLTSFLLAQPILSSERKQSFRAAVLATQAAAAIHTQEGDPATLWRAAEDALQAYPAKFGSERLRLRILCGLATETGLPPAEDPRELDEQCRASLLAAWEAAIERAELESRPIARAEVLESIAGSQLRPFALLLVARASLLGNKPWAADEFFKAAAELASKARPGAWLDWIPPDDLLPRIQLEQVRSMPRSAEAIFYASAQINLRPSQSIDTDRLWSALIQTVGRMPGGRSDLPWANGVVRRPRCNAHRQVAPFNVIRAEIEARTDPASALAALREYSEKTKSARIPDVALEADRAIARILLRQRLISEGWTLPATLVTSTATEDVLLRTTVRALHLSGQPGAEAIQVVPPEPLPSRGLPWDHAERLMRQAERADLRGEASALNQMRAALVDCNDIGDRNGALMASCSLALSLARRHLAFSEIAADMEKMALPTSSWETVRDAVVSGDMRFLSAVDPTWRPWIVRCLAVKVLEHDSRLRSEAAKNLSTWLKDNYLVDVKGTGCLPFELALVERKPLLGPAVTRILAIGLAAAFGFAVVAGWFLAAWPVASLIAGGSIFPVRLLITLGVMAAYGVGLLALARVTQYLMRQPWMWSPLSVQFEPELETNPTDPNRPLQSPWRWITQARILLMPTIKSAGGPTEGTDETKYRALMPAISRDRSSQVARQYQFFRALNFIFDVKIVTDIRAAAAPWEALFGLPSAEFSRFRDHPFRFSRSIRPRKPLPQPDWPGRVQVITWSAAGVGLDRTGLHFRTRRGKKVREVIFETATNSIDYNLVRPHVGVARIVGTPVESAGDIFLAVGGQERGEKPYWASGSDLKRRYPALRLLIVEAPPSDLFDRTPSDRLEAAQLRRFGAVAFQASIPAVLVVPAIPRNLANDLTSTLYNLLKRQPTLLPSNGAAAILRMTRDLQLKIDSLPQRDPDTPLELAFDVCLFIEDSVNLTIQESEQTDLTTPPGDTE